MAARGIFRNPHGGVRLRVGRKSVHFEDANTARLVAAILRDLRAQAQPAGKPR